MKDSRMSITNNFDDDFWGAGKRYLRPIYDNDGENGYEWIDVDDYEYFHDFDSYYRFMNRLPVLRRLMDRGEFVGNDISHPLFDS